MADNITTNPGTGGAVLATDDIGGVQHPRTKVGFGVDGAYVDVSASDPLPITGALTDAQLRASAVSVQSTAQAATGAVPAAAPSMMLVGGIRRDADTPWPGADDGEFSPALINRDGRLKTAGAPAQFDPVVGDITASAQTVSADVSSASNLVVHVTGTFAGHNCTFEGSIDGGTTWVGVQGVRSNANTIETTTGVLGATPAYAWEFSVNAFTNFRVRATAHGSGTATWRFTLGSYATEPIPAIQTHPVTGSGNFNTVAQAGTNLMGDVGLQVRANATGAASIHHIVSAATTNVAQIKATAGRVLGYCLSNTTATWQYVKLHNVASATAGSAVAMTIGLPPNGKAECHIAQGIAFGTAISRSIVTGPADADNTATTLNAVVGDIFFA